MKRSRLIFKGRKSKIKRPESIRGLVCDEAEELFVRALRKDKLLLMAHPEIKGRHLLVKGISIAGEIEGLRGEVGNPVALDPETQELFGVQIKPKGIVLHHLGYFSGAWEDRLPDFKAYAKKHAKK